jgi:hypothetical protein
VSRLVDSRLWQKEQCRSGRVPDGISEGRLSAAAALMPRETHDLGSKFALNSFEMDDGSEGLFVHMAYANHSCVPSAVHHSIESQGGLKLLVASREIDAGEEVCHQYVSLEGAASLAQRGGTMPHFLKEVWGFDCACPACSTPAISARLARMRTLDAALVACSASDVREPDGPARFDEALRLGVEQIALHDELRCSPNHYARTHHLLFQLAVTRRATLPQARLHIAQAKEQRELLVGKGTVCAQLARFGELERAPEKHQAYFAGD